MQPPQNLLEIYDLYIQYLKETFPLPTSTNFVREIGYTFTSNLLIGLGYGHKPTGIKLTYAELQAARSFMATQKLEVLLHARSAQQEGSRMVERSQKMQDIYKRSLEKFLYWSQQQTWWPGERPFLYSSNTEELCSSKLQGKYGSKSAKNITHRRGRPIHYGLKPKEISQELRAEIDLFFCYLTAPEYPLRPHKAVKVSTAKKNYIREILLFLGWFYHFEQVPLDSLSLNILIPKVCKHELKNLTAVHEKKLWKEKKQLLETWISCYFTFLRENMQSFSPRTKRGKLAALSALGRFQYHTEVEFMKDFQNIPILKVIENQLAQTYHKLAEWNRSKRYVSNQDEKWPRVEEGKTALTTVREEILEPLRLACRPKDSSNKRRSGTTIASSLKQYIAWFFLAAMPARRQEEYRELKMALCCPIERPDLPAGAVYHPLPPKEIRDQRHDGTIDDNYIYKTYFYQGKHYKDGLWILDIQEYKMRDKYGSQSIVIKDRQFEDGTCLYDYIDHYLYGWWLPGGRKNQSLYDWWDLSLIARRGRWVSLGRASFEPCDVCHIEHKRQTSFWTWGYFFLGSLTGLPLENSQFEELIESAAYHYTGKQISPHIMRSVWATWAYQIGLTDQQKVSLAYAMGHDIRTLKTLYERSSPDEKRRLIEEAIDRLFFEEKLINDVPRNPSLESGDLEEEVKALTPDQRQKLLKMLTCR